MNRRSACRKSDPCRLNVPPTSCQRYPPSAAPPLGYKYVTPLKRSMSFLSPHELLSYKAIPALGVAAYLGTAVGTVAHHQTFEGWLGSEYRAISMINALTVSSMLGMAIYIYGRRNTRHAGPFQKMIYPIYGSVFFNCASHFSWAFIKEMYSNQSSFDYKWSILTSLFTGCVLLYTGRSYLHFVDEW